MPTFDPRIIALFCLLFIALGIFSIITGRRRLLEGRAQGFKLAWYRQVGILTGIEYILLAITFLTSISVNAGWLPKSWSQVLVPLYIVMLFASLLLAGLVIYQGFATSRRNRQMATPGTNPTKATPLKTSNVVEKPERVPDMEERSMQIQKRRERRKKAAEARRRRAGKA